MTEDIQGWFAGSVPGEWFVDPVEVTIDRDEVLVVGRLAPPLQDDDASPDAVTAAEHARIEGHRTDTRDQRIRIAEGS